MVIKGLLGRRTLYKESSHSIAAWQPLEDRNKGYRQDIDLALEIWSGRRQKAVKPYVYLRYLTLASLALA